MHELHVVVIVSQVPIFVCKQLRKTVIKVSMPRKKKKKNLQKNKGNVYLNIFLYEGEFCHIEASHLKLLTDFLEALFCQDTDIQAFHGVVSGVPPCWTGNCQLAP